VDDKLLDEVRQVVADTLSRDLSEVKPDATFDGDLGADSLSLVELVMALEEKFGLDSIPDEDAQGITTPRQAAEYIVSRRAGAPS